MTINEVYNSLGQFVMDLIGENDWTRAELNIKIQPKVLGMSGNSFNGEQRTNLRTKYPEELGNKIKWLHELTTEGGNNKWNKGKFVMTPDDKFEFEFIWDEEWQNEVDSYNKAEKDNDPSYEIPKWHWEK